MGTVSDTFVSVVAPLRDDADIVEAFVREVAAVLEAHYANYEIVLVDDGSEDDTPARVDALLGEVKCLRYVRLSRTFGPDVAISAGLDSVIGDWVVIMMPDADPPALVPELVGRARAGSGVVFAVRSARSDEPLWARAGASLFYAVANRAFRMDLPRHISAFQVLSRQTVNGITRNREKYRSLRLLTQRVGFRRETVPYQPLQRRGTARTRGLLESISLAAGLIVSHSTKPLRAVALLGLVASALNLLYILYVVAIFLFKRRVQEGWTTTSLQASSMFFLLFLILAVLSEYVGRILDEAKDRPLYHVVEERSSRARVADADRRNVVQDSVVPSRGA